MTDTPDGKALNLLTVGDASALALPVDELRAIGASADPLAWANAIAEHSDMNVSDHWRDIYPPARDVLAYLLDGLRLRARPTIPDVLAEVAAERFRQITKGYDAAHDDAHSVDTIARNAALIINGSIGGWVDASRHSRRDQLIIGAALAVAAIERLDREAVNAA